MMSIQTTIPFNVRKRCSFYGSKRDTVREDFSEATVPNTPSKYTPTVRKMVTLSSSESASESESDVENACQERNVHTERRKPLRSSIRITRRTVPKSSETNATGGSSTPPKQKKLDKALMDSPSCMLDRLNLMPPCDKEEMLLPKRLFTMDKYSSARKALHSSTSDSLPGREREMAQLEEFIRSNVQSCASASLYVCGPPGTGKTACLSKIMCKEELATQVKTVYVNCTSMKSAATIYSKIIDELGINVSGKPSKTSIEKYLLSNHEMLLLVLDEIDQLQSKQQSVLYSIFEWPSKPNSKLILVGIANSLDLTDRVLPRLQTRCELKPKLMHFLPYDKQQILSIISARLIEANVADVFTTSALRMLAGKVAAVSGDIRRALDISRRLVEIAESHKRTHVLQPTTAANFDTKKQSIEKQVDLQDVISVLNGVYAGSQNIRKEDTTFPLQQKLLLCSLLLILNKGRNKDVTIRKLHEVYKKVCRKRNIHAVDVSEFVSLCSLIETRGVLRIIGKREPRLSKISLQWDQEELDAALQEKNMLTEIINDVTCL